MPYCPAARRSLLAKTAFAATLGLGSLTMASPAAAHMGSTKYVEAELTPQGAQLTVNVDATDAALALGLGMTADAQELAVNDALVSGWLASGLSIEGEAGPCESRAFGQPTLTTKDGRDYVSVGLAFECPQPMGVVTLADETIFDDDPDHEVFVKVRGPGGDEAHILRDDRRSVALGATQSAADTAGTFLVEGGIHLVTGYDHLLFLLSLILAAGLIVRKQGLRPAMRDVAWVVTAFTVGHSLSLIAATLGWLTLPSRVVESAIAASIVLVAGMNVLRPQASVARPWLAGVFGLVHGFGFSSVLADVGLPTGQRIVALLSFNVGIELAQLAFVALVLLPLSLFAGHRRYRLVVMQGGSLAIAAFGCVWLVERSLGL